MDWQRERSRDVGSGRIMSLDKESVSGISQEQQSMRILFISTETRPIVGGIARTLDGWLSGMAELGHDVTMVGLLSESALVGRHELLPRLYREEWLTLPERCESRLDKILPLRKMRSAVYVLLRDHFVRQSFILLLEEIRPDWVIFSVVNSVCCIPIKETKRRRLKCAAITYGSEIHPTRVKRPKWLRRTFRQLGLMIAISEHTRLMLLKWGVSNERIAIVHPALDPDLIARVEQKLPLRNEEYQDQDESLRLLTICRLVERKGVQTVLKALRMLRQEFPNLHYDIVGDGPFRNELEELVYELDLDDIVKFHGLISDTAREALLQMCDIFIMVPFESADGDIEGFGIVYLEAGLHGVAVAGSRSGGMSIRMSQRSVTLNSIDGSVAPNQSTLK